MPKNVNNVAQTTVVQVNTGRRRHHWFLATIGVLILLGLAIKFWFIVLPVVVIAAAILIPMRVKALKERQAAEALAAQKDADEEALAKEVRLSKLRNQQHKLDKEFYADEPTP